MLILIELLTRDYNFSATIEKGEVNTFDEIGPFSSQAEFPTDMTQCPVRPDT
jgi:hypothetical protein